MLINIPIQMLLVWLACHFVGDFAFQSTWMSVEKGKSWEINFYHCATYTATFILFARPSLTAAIPSTAPNRLGRKKVWVRRIKISGGLEINVRAD